MIYLILIFSGLCLGSFVNAYVWRQHAKQKVTNKKRLKELSIWNGRSMCPNCRHTLGVFDLVPVFSWLWLRGRCRYCHKPISWQYPLVELLTASIFVFSYVFWPYTLHGADLFQFCLWLAFLTGFMALSVYDIKWQTLPNRIIYPLLCLAIAQVVTIAAWTSDRSILLDALWGFLVLAGVFYVLFQLSSGKWIGGGDVKLGAVLGIIIGGPLSGLLLLLVASIAGTFYSLPLIARGQAKRNSRVPFGPFLIIGAVIVQLFGASIINWYKNLLS